MKTLYPKIKNNKIYQTKTIAKQTKFYASLKPLFYLTKLVGVNALTLTNENGEPNVKVKKTDVYYLLAYLSFYSSLYAYNLYKIFTESNTTYFDIMPQSIIFAKTAILTIVISAVVISTFFFRHLIVDTITMMLRIDMQMRNFGIYMNSRKIAKSIKILLMVMVISVLCRTVLFLGTVDVDFLQQLGAFLATLIKSLPKFGFVASITPVFMRFARINKDIERCLLGKSPFRREKMAENLYALCRLHYKLCSVARTINTAFAFQLLFSVAATLSDVLYDSYYLYVVIDKGYDRTTAWHIACPVAWLLDEILEMYLLVYASSITCEHANNTPILLHELRNRIDIPEIEQHIQMYSLQLLHQKIQFSVLGFFTIDYSLLYSIAGAVTTYLVIFIQFDQSQTTNSGSLTTKNISQGR